jgi:ABC-2 type transport system permease protein
MTLLRQHVKEERLSLLIWSLIFGMLGVYIVVLWKMMSGTGLMADLDAMMQQLPGPLRAMMASEMPLSTLNGWIQGFGQWMAIPLTIYTALLAAGILSREMDRHTIEFLLALPVSRAQVLITRWGGMAIALAVLHLVHVLTLIISVRAVGENPLIGPYFLAELNSYLLYLDWAASSS